eukprot:SAG11_NODE_29517_length_310_cov_0.677725_1_plen_24_part_10
MLLPHVLTVRGLLRKALPFFMPLQ